MLKIFFCKKMSRRFSRAQQQQPQQQFIQQPQADDPWAIYERYGAGIKCELNLV